MAICGTITLEDCTIEFNIGDNDECQYTVSDIFTGQCEHLIAPGQKVMKALAIALHYDGMPDYKVDYSDAESVQGKIRWIP